MSEPESTVSGESSVGPGSLLSGASPIYNGFRIASSRTASNGQPAGLFGPPLVPTIVNIAAL